MALPLPLPFESLTESVAPASAIARAPATDAELVLAIRAGHREAGQILFDRHATRITGLAYRLLGADNEVDDVVQESFLQALRHLDQLKDPDAFGSWLYAITIRNVRKVFARGRMLERLGLRRPLEFKDDMEIARTAPPEVLEELKALYCALARVNAQTRLALLLRNVEGHTVNEVAEQLGVSLSTAKRRIAEGEAAVERHRTRREEHARRRGLE